jgi:hypothetical protein
MSRYTAQLESAAAVANNTGIAWLMSSSTGGFRLRRVTVGLKLATAAATTDYQAVLGINRVTSAGTTPTAGMTPVKMEPWTTAAAVAWDSGFATPPTLASDDAFRIDVNTKNTVDLPWEFLENFVVLNGTSNGLAFVNRAYALPASHSYVLAVQWEE